MAARDLTTSGEENELLNGSGSRVSIKMQDAPFDRAGSEEDMLEYEDPIINCDACKIKRQCTKPEKILIGFVAIFLIVIIALSVALGNKKEHEPPKFCTSKGCLQAASSLLGAMDRTADPCEDFHQYSCGGWLKETPIPPGYPIWDRFQELAYKNLYMLKSFIETHTMIGSAQSKVKLFYQSCISESTVKRNKTITDIKGLVDSLDTVANGSVSDLLQTVHRLGVWPFFQLIVGPNEMDPERNVIKLETGFSPFPFNSFKVVTEEKTMKSRNANSSSSDLDAHSVPNNVTTVVSNQTNSPAVTTPAQPTYTVEQSKPPPIRENVTDLVQEFLAETVSILRTVLKLSPADANKTAYQILDLERRLSLAHDIEQHIHNRTQAYNSMKVSELHMKCPIVEWAFYLNKIVGSNGNPITDNHEVIILHESALLKVCDIVKEYSANSTLLGLLKQYLKVSITRSLKPYFDLSTFREDLSPEQELDIEGEHWRRCTFYANKALGFASGAIYVNGTSSQNDISQIKYLVDYVKRAFKQYLLRKMWMDQKTKASAAAKIEEMIEKVSYPTFILNTTFLDEYYKQMNVGDDWFRNILNWRAFTVLKMATTLKEKFDRKNSWINPPVTVESDYSAVRNDMIFPIAMFHLPVYSPDGPIAMNLGAMGSIIGHEITHAFDIQGRQYDGFGKLRDWWDPVTADMFNKTTTCMRDQYSRFKVGNLQVDGERTLEENIADNGGIRAAKVAYELWLNEHGDEQPLPGVDLTNRQIFYVSFAQLFCSKWKPGGIKDFLLRDTHSPGPYRIEGALSNSLAFQEVFQCSYVSKYNPATKCQVW